MTTVFFLYLFHFALGLLASLLFVPERAGAKYFKLCSAIATTMLTAALFLALRRFGWASDPRAPGQSHYPAVVGAGALALGLCVLYNRAVHFGWKRGQAILLGATLLAGFASVLAGANEPQRALAAASDLTSVLLLGAAAAAMILGHFYLVVVDLPIQALRRLTVLLIVALVLRFAVVAWALFSPGAPELDAARRVAAGLWSPDGVFVWMRVLFGIAGPISLLWFIWKTVEIRSTQSATGILYVQLFLVMAGELLAKYLRVAAGFPL